MKTFSIIMKECIILIVILKCCCGLPTNHNNKDSILPTLALADRTQVYGSEPYELTLHENPKVQQFPIFQRSDLIGSSSAQYSPISYRNRHQSYQIKQDGSNGGSIGTEYDPFYFNSKDFITNDGISNGRVGNGGIRSRRNSKYRDLSREDPFLTDNAIFDEGAHFFRRANPSASHSSAQSTQYGKESSLLADESYRYHSKESYFPHHRRSSLPFYQSSSRIFPPSRTSLMQSLSSSNPHYDRYSGYTNQLQYPFEARERHPIYPTSKHYERYGRDPIDGWAVQVGTQLTVHDDGRERFPAKFYVRDEKLSDLRRFPHH